MTTTTIAPILPVAPMQPSEEVVREVVRVLSAGGVIAFPTDTLYGIGCELGRARAIERIQQLRGIDGSRRPLTFLLPDLGLLPQWATVGPAAHRILNRIFPGPYCVELSATDRVPNPYVNQERRTIGVRIPDSAFCERVLWLLGRPILTATAKSRAGTSLTTAQQIQSEYGAELDLIIDAGTLAGPPSTVVSLVDDWVDVLREGRGPSGKVLAG
jgi:tRNA threonylcarbamoyl adenosine modification protein (Sua5/YciO/YrdC/YwlC family)